MAYLALYRLYRPQNFGQVAGQDHITKTLRNQVQMGRIGHAYLFSGARGTGKTSTAKVFARAVNCLSPKEGEPCGECEVCRMSNEDLSVDILEIDAASNNGVDEIRDLREKISFAPAICKYKVYIIDEVHMLSTGAFNALLKTLEEPPPHAVFILATTELQKLPATILSRCQRFDFKRIPESVIIQQLQDVAQKQGAECEPAAIEAVAHAAGGGMRDALSIFDQCLGFAGDVLKYDDVVQVLGAAGAETARRLAEAAKAGDARSCMQLVDDVYSGGADMAVFARELIEYFRQDMMESAAQGKAGLALRAVTELSRAESSMRYSPQPRVTLEAALVRLCVATEEQDVSALIERIERLEATVEQLAKRPVQVIEQAVQKEQAPLEKTAPLQAETDTPPWDVQHEDADALPEGDDAPPWDVAQDEKPPAETKRAQQSAQAEVKPPQDEPQPTGKAQPAGDMHAVYKEMLAILRKEANAAYQIIKFGELQALQDGILTVTFGEQDDVMVNAMRTDRYANAANDAASRAAGSPVRVNCVVGKAAVQAAQPQKAEANDGNEQQDMLEQVKNVFGMDIEITD